MESKYKYTISVLFKEYTKLGGTIFAREFVRSNATNEEKRSLEAMEFLGGLLSGEFNNEEEAHKRLMKSEDYKKMVELAEIINYLSEQQNETQTNKEGE